jgi:hypothetical protein
MSELKDEINDYDRFIKRNQNKPGKESDLANVYNLKSTTFSRWCEHNKSAEYLPQALEAVTLAIQICPPEDKSICHYLHERAYLYALLNQKESAQQDLTQGSLMSGSGNAVVDMHIKNLMRKIDALI